MKIVYALVSNNKDYFYEQCLISVISLKRKMNNAEIVVLVDDATNDNLNGKRSALREYANIIVVDFPKNMGPKERSRLLKICSREVIDGKYLYVDVDTVVVDEITSIEGCEADVAMVLDKHCDVFSNFRGKYIRDNANTMGYSTGFDNKHFNGGVIFVNDSKKATDFFALWKRLYYECVGKGLLIDQTSLNEANNRLGGLIYELPGEWNVQLDCGINYISTGHIFHYSGYQPFNKHNKYFNLLPFELCEDGLFKTMKASGVMNDDILRILDNPRKAFKQSYLVSADSVAYSLLFSNHFRVLKFMAVNLNRFFWFMESIYQKLFKMIYRRV